MRKFKAWLYLFMASLAFAPSSALARFVDAPLARLPSVSQTTLEIFAETESRRLLSDHLDQHRPSPTASEQLTNLLERAQRAWLEGSVDSARARFKDIAELALEEDWRPAQRESIQYSLLRLAQSATEFQERQKWLKKAAGLFPDLTMDASLFPPPLQTEFKSARALALDSSIVFNPYEAFEQFRYLIINGRRFLVTPDLKVRLPEGSYRVTGYSDLVQPFTKIMTRAELLNFRPRTQIIAQGDCESPQALDIDDGVPTLTVLYSAECARTRENRQWLAKKFDQSGSSNSKISSLRANSDLETKLSPTASAIPPESASKRHPTWLKTGLAILALGAGYGVYLAMSPHSSETPQVQVLPNHK